MFFLENDHEKKNHQKWFDQKEITKQEGGNQSIFAKSIEITTTTQKK